MLCEKDKRRGLLPLELFVCLESISVCVCAQECARDRETVNSMPRSNIVSLEMLPKHIITM